MQAASAPDGHDGAHERFGDRVGDVGEGLGNEGRAHAASLGRSVRSKGGGCLLVACLFLLVRSSGNRLLGLCFFGRNCRSMTSIIPYHERFRTNYVQQQQVVLRYQGMSQNSIWFFIRRWPVVLCVARFAVLRRKG